MNAMTLQNKVALVTGAGSGIGRAVSLALQKAGYSVVLAGRRADELKKTAEAASGGQMLAVPTDIGQPDAVKALFARTKETFGRLDLLFNNAGMGTPAIPMEDLTYEQWSAVVAVNLTGSFLCAQEAIRMMKAQDPRGGYTATKHDITGLTKSISLDCRKYDICCGQIDIGNAATEMTQRMSSGVLQANGELAVEPRMDVNNVADAVLYMAGLPLTTNVLFMTVMANTMPFVGRG
jgi:NAD(P)-dependent dehydrogenase (short-subunit alcohol dehydrogenase family)